MNTHISYKTAKALKEFLGESAPEPIADCKLAYYGKDLMHYVPNEVGTAMHREIFSGFAYQLHDLLSKPFCEAFNRRFVCENNVEKANPLLMSNIAYAYYYGGIEAVEKALIEMMLPDVAKGE